MSLNPKSDLHSILDGKSSNGLLDLMTEPGTMFEAKVTHRDVDAVNLRHPFCRDSHSSSECANNIKTIARRILAFLQPLAVVVPLAPLTVGVLPLASHNGSHSQQIIRVSVGKRVAGDPFRTPAVIHVCDDFDFNDIDSFGNWVYVGSTPLSFVPWQLGHHGILSIPTGTMTGVSELIGDRVCGRSSASFAAVDTCVARFVVSCDALFAGSSGFDGEWFVGIGNPDGTGNVYAGALLNFAPGFTDRPSSELLAGSYISRFSRAYSPTNFIIAANRWYDLIISWTPRVIKYYAAVYGQTPALIATITTKISTEPQYLLIGNCRYRNGSPSVNLLVDKVEWLCKTSQSESLLLKDLLKF